MSLIWHIVQVSPATERRVFAAVRERGFSAYLPCERRWKSVRGKPSEATDFPMFPGYLFIGIGPDNKRHELAKVQGLIGVVNTAWPAEKLSAWVYRAMTEQLAGEYDRTGQARVSTRAPVGPMATSLGHGMEAMRALLVNDAKGRLDLDFGEAADEAA